MISFIVRFKQIIDKYNRDEMTVYAAQASFFIILSSVPFIMVLLTLIQFIPDLDQQDIVASLIAVIPNVKTLDPMITYLVDDIFTRSPGTVLSITALTALWSASRGMFSIERGLNRVLESTEKRNYILNRLICTGYTIIFILVCILSLLLLIFGTSIQNFLSRTFPIVAAVTEYLISLRALLSLAILIAFFTGLYTFVPVKKQLIKRQLPGALFTTVCWIAFSFAFSIYFNHFSNFSYMYGSLTGIVLLMLWVYICICILFLGAEINFYLTENSEDGFS